MNTIRPAGAYYENISPNKPIAHPKNKSDPRTSFQNFQFHEKVDMAINKMGFSQPTDIQEKSIPHILIQRDVLGTAKTGSGKTAAFLLPIINNLLERETPKRTPIKTLIVAPTRELAIQIGDTFYKLARYTNLKHITIYGGVKQFPQVKELRKNNIAVLIATPGRLLDLINQGHISLDKVNTLVLDEADRMLDMGFLPDIKRIFRLLPPQRQSLMFSATMPPQIKNLVHQFFKKDFVTIEGTKESVPLNKISQNIYFVEKSLKWERLRELLKNPQMKKAIVFSRTKHGADKIVRKLRKAYFSAEAMHGNKSQNARQKTLLNFKHSKTQILVATDVAARGLDVDDISHVINYDLPEEAETYLHRIGRTARAGKEGTAISLCSKDERKYFKRIERLVGRNQITKH